MIFKKNCDLKLYKEEPWYERHPLLVIAICFVIWLAMGTFDWWNCGGPC